MSSHPHDVIFRLFQRIVQLHDEDVEFRSNLSGLVASARQSCNDGAVAEIPTPEPAIVGQSAAPEVIPELQPILAASCNGDGGNDQIIKGKACPQPPLWNATTDADLPAIEQRCRLKCEAIRWAIARKSAILAGGSYRIEVAATNRDFFERATSIGDCSLWMLHPAWQMPSDCSQMKTLAACFDALADALSLARVTLTERETADFFEPSIGLVAEAQSALRVAVERVTDRSDRDQAAAFTWLRFTANERRIHITNYMRLDDAADPAETSTLSARISTLASEVKNKLAVARERRRLFGKMKYVLEQLAQDKGERVENWQAIAQTIDDLIATGVPPSNKEIRESLLPVIAGMPAFQNLPQGFSSVVKELDRHRGAQPRQRHRPNKPPIPPEVKQVRTLLKRKTVLLIGGHRRNHARSRLERALKLKRLDWISTTEHESVKHFRAAVANPEVAVVLLAIRFSSHSFKKVQEFCNEYGKPFVRLPTGYNPGQVASQILSQCGDRLKAASQEMRT